jgi:leucyl-tRNA synthetase
MREELGAHGPRGSVHQQPGPPGTPPGCEETIQIAVQVNGRVRAVVEIPAEASEMQVQELALAQPRVRQQIGTQALRKIVYVPGKVINLVI